MKPGIIENIVLVMNMAEFSFQKAPIYIAKHLINSIGANYKGHARAVFLVNAPTAFSMVWNTIKYFLDENQVRKVKIVSANSCPSLLELAAPNQLEEKFGGTAKNKEAGEFWPPSCPDTNFGVGKTTDLSNV